ncbi:MAG TPA: alpha/beta hydrolase [Verrucomicrobiae bacterium]|jgi:acetyl esterase/lipase|nr:alpha/beta hydrolase [Verrucomicrobiae bacterium]
MKAALALWLATAAALSAQPLVLPLWTNGAPGFESRRDEPELAKDYWVRNINNPSLTVFLPPKDKANGAAVVICPGGGFRELVFNAEGADSARYFTNLGVAAFVLKYRLPRETNSPYSIDKHPLQDGQRAMRVVRHHAAEWGLDSARIGIEGFSAGGEVASLVCYAPTEGDPNAADPVDRESARADFEISIYPGPYGAPTQIPTNAPPVFFACTGVDDWFHCKVIADLIPQYGKLKIPFEVHIFAHGQHGFNMGYRSKLKSVKGFPDRLTDWLSDNWILDPSQPDRHAR